MAQIFILYENTCIKQQMRLILIYFLHVVHGIWEDICQWLHISRRITTVRSVLKWMKKDVQGSSRISRARRIAFQSMVYMTWTTRNKVLKEWLCLNPQMSIKVFIYARFPGFERSVAHGLWTGPWDAFTRDDICIKTNNDDDAMLCSNMILPGIYLCLVRIECMGVVSY